MSHSLRVKLLSGHDLLSADAHGFSDPYVDIFVWCPSRATCKHMWRSETKMKTLNPRWAGDDSATNRCDLLTENALLHVCCLDWDRMGTDDFLGECLVDLRQYADGRLHKLKLVLDQYDSSTKTNDNNDEVTGHIMIELQMTPEVQGTPAKPRTGQRF